jgi:hypothetical protein
MTRKFPCGSLDRVSAAVIAASSSIVVAVLAFILNQFGQVRQERRHARLDRVNRQLRDLYGPLNALVDANERIWAALRATQLPKERGLAPDDGEASWRRWRDSALQPANVRMRDLIVTNADLLVEAEFPETVRDLCAHVAAQDVVRAAEADSIPGRALIPHPGEAFTSYVRTTFAALKRQQALLLRQGHTLP